MTADVVTVSKVVEGEYIAISVVVIAAEVGDRLSVVDMSAAVAGVGVAVKFC